MPPKKSEWKCRMCTLLNPPSLKKCTVCKTARCDEVEKKKKKGAGEEETDNKLVLDSQEDKSPPASARGKKRKVEDSDSDSDSEATAPTKKQKKAPTQSDTSSDTEMSSVASSNSSQDQTPQCSHVYKLSPSHTKDGWKYTCDSCQEEPSTKDKVYICKKKGCDYTLCKQCKEGKKKGESKSKAEKKVEKVENQDKAEKKEVAVAVKNPGDEAKREQKPAASPPPAAKPAATTPTATPKTLGMRLRSKTSLSPGDGPKGRYSRPTASLRKPVLRCGLAKPPPRFPDD